MQKLQLYIEGQKADLFEDEIVEMTSSIQDVRDIGKIFTEYTQTFTIPASPTNNRIFKHFYNYYITNGYDARKKKSAEIHLNYMPFKEGKIFLSSVAMKFNKPYAYTVIFYGKLVSLKDLMGDDKLSDLNLTEFNHAYSDSNVKTIFENGLTVNSDPEAIIYPLITSEKRLFYNTEFSDTDPENTNGNLYRDVSSPDIYRGLEYKDLKPAIRLYHLIKAIETKYSITFTNDFFNTTNQPFYKLYMWLNGVRGNLVDQEQYGSYFFSKPLGLTSEGTTMTLDYRSNSVDLAEWSHNNTTGILTLTAPRQDNYRFIFRVSNISAQANIKIKLTDISTGAVYEKTRFTSSSFEEEIILFKQTGTYQFTMAIEADRFISVQVWPEFDTVGSVQYEGYVIPTFSLNGNIDLSNKNVMPDMKVIDFITGIFKMFNLTAYYITDRRDADYGKIYVDTLDNFYNNVSDNHFKGVIDIGKYVDISLHNVNATLPFSEIYFKYEEPRTLLAEKHQEVFNEVFGNSEYNIRKNSLYPQNREIDLGAIYEINIPFSHMKYERLIDGNESAASRDTLLQWGYSASGEYDYQEGKTADGTTTPPTYETRPTGDYDPVLDKPLVFYANKIDLSSAPKYINWVTVSGASRSTDSVSGYFFPSNSINDGTPTTPPSATIHFDYEFDEWQGSNAVYDYESPNSLYHVYYKRYVERVFNPINRLFKITAHLPAYILLNYRLNDKIKIHDKLFTINSITTNLNTGKTELELLNYIVTYNAEPLLTDSFSLTADSTLLTSDRTDIFV